MQVVIGRFAVQLGESKQRNRSEQTEEFGSVAAFLAAPTIRFHESVRRGSRVSIGFVRLLSRSWPRINTGESLSLLGSKKLRNCLVFAIRISSPRVFEANDCAILKALGFIDLYLHAAYLFS